jgi:hypothetical protein
MCRDVARATQPPGHDPAGGVAAPAVPGRRSAKRGGRACCEQPPGRDPAGVAVVAHATERPGVATRARGTHITLGHDPAGAGPRGNAPASRRGHGGDVAAWPRSGICHRRSRGSRQPFRGRRPWMRARFTRPRFGRPWLVTDHAGAGRPTTFLDGRVRQLGHNLDGRLLSVGGQT